MSNFAKSGFKRVKDLYLQDTMFLLSSDVFTIDYNTEVIGYLNGTR